MHVNWVIESGVYDQQVEPLLTEIRKQGMHGQLVPHRVLLSGLPLQVANRPLADDACVIAYGTFPFVRQIQLHYSWRPGSWCNLQELDCRTYFPVLGDALLNHDGVILSTLDALQQQVQLAENYGVSGSVFVRPTACNKTFVGRSVRLDELDSVLATARYEEAHSDASHILIAPSKRIRREWRLVVIDDVIIGGSQYANGGNRDVVAGVPSDVQEFAQGILRKTQWRPDPAFMLDVGESDHGLGIVELNSFSSSWLYASPLAEVIRAAGELAIREWNSTLGGFDCN